MKSAILWAALWLWVATSAAADESFQIETQWYNCEVKWIGLTRDEIWGAINEIIQTFHNLPETSWMYESGSFSIWTEWASFILNNWLSWWINELWDIHFISWGKLWMAAWNCKKA